MVKIGFVGCGGIAQEHLKQLRTMNEVRMVGVCDANAARARAFAATAGCEAHFDPVSLYDKAKPDAVYVTVPPFAHGAIEEEAAARGIHLFVEKPVSLDMATASRVSGAIKRAGILSAAGYCYRYCDTIDTARAMLKGKAVSLVNGAWIGGLPATAWWRRRDQSGGQILEQTTHLFDLVRYLCGPVQEVHAMASRGCMSRIEGFDVDDSSVVALRLKTGAVASVISTCIIGHPGRTQLEIVTPEFTLTLAGRTVRVEEDHRVTEYRPECDMYAEENRAFIDAVRTGKKNGIRSTYADAVKTLQVTCAANESAATGMPVKL
jgi:predicted dehydrogenase